LGESQLKIRKGPFSELFFVCLLDLRDGKDTALKQSHSFWGKHDELRPAIFGVLLTL
jgi:hypothetical protein